VFVTTDTNSQVSTDPQAGVAWEAESPSTLKQGLFLVVRVCATDCKWFVQQIASQSCLSSGQHIAGCAEVLCCCYISVAWTLQCNLVMVHCSFCSSNSKRFTSNCISTSPVLTTILSISACWPLMECHLFADSNLQDLAKLCCALLHSQWTFYSSISYGWLCAVFCAVRHNICHAGTSLMDEVFINQEANPYVLEVDGTLDLAGLQLQPGSIVINRSISTCTPSCRQKMVNWYWHIAWWIMQQEGLGWCANQQN